MHRPIINIRPDDIMWHYYCKFFTINGKKVEPPQNLCRYFWLSVAGFGLWIGREARLYKIWLIGLTVIIASLITLASFKSPIIIGALFTIYVLVITFLLLVTFYRLSYYLKTKAQWVLDLIGFCGIAFVLGLIITQKDFRQWLKQDLLICLRDGTIILKYAGVLLIAMIAIAIIYSLIPSRHSQKLPRLVQTFIAFLRAKKTKSV